MRLYRSRRDANRQDLASQYSILGFLASGTYGRVYKASSTSDGTIVAIKRFKPDRDSDASGPVYTGISQSACREIMVGQHTKSYYTAAAALLTLNYTVVCS